MTPCASSVYQGVDLWNYNDTDNNDDDDSKPPGVPVANPITGDYLRELYTSQMVPDTFVGPVSVKRIKGRGLGLVAATPLSVGQVIAITHPLAIVHGHPANPPQLSDLVLHLKASQLPPHQRLAFDQLYDGTPRTRNSKSLPDLSSMSPSLPPSLTASLHNLTSLPYPADQLINIVRYNAFGDSSADLITGRLRGDPIGSLLGIWPEVALANHSCAPNAVHFNIGECMVVRAVRDIALGEEVLLNYLGRGAMMPIAHRQEELGATYGFQCRCARCRAESQHEDVFDDLLDAVLSILEEVKPAVISALRQQHTEHLTTLLQLLKDLDGKLQEACQHAGINEDAIQWLKAGAYDLYQLMALVEEGLHPMAYRTLCSMSDCVEVAGFTVPGSDLHVLTACKFVRKVEDVYKVKSDPRVTSAQTIGLSAVKARYGPLDAESLRLMLDTGAELAAELDDVMLSQTAA